MECFVAYYRVSTQGQGRSGLGLAAQRQAVSDYVARAGGKVLDEFEEVESGKADSRPELEKALALANLTGARLLIAKLDRLSRNVAFLAALMDRGVKFVACDMPEANELTLHIMAAVAQAERKAISARTSAALGAINAKLSAGERHVSRRSGKSVTKLGNPEGLSVSRPDLGTAAIKRNADNAAAKLLPYLKGMVERQMSLAQMAGRLTEMGVRTPRDGKEWTPTGVKRVLDRLRLAGEI